MSDPQLISADPNYGLEPHISAAVHNSALPDVVDPNEVTLGELIENPRESLQKIGANLKRDASDPRTWLSLAASYFGPKLFNAAGPVVARAAAGAVRGVSEVATPGMVKDLATVGLGDGRVSAGLRIGGRVVDAVKAARGAPPAVETATPAPPVAAPEPAALPSAPVKPATAPSPQAGDVPSAAGPRIGKEPHLTLEEFQAAQKLVKQGYSQEEVLRAIQQNRIPRSWLNLPTDEEMAATVAKRNATGKWPK